MALGKHLGQFVANSFARDLMDPACQLLNRGKCFRLDGVSETCSKTHRAQHAQFIFRETQLRPPDGSNDPCIEVLASTDEIQHFILDGIEQQSVDGEVAALNIFLRTFAEAHLVRMAAVAVADIAAEGGDLDGVAANVSSPAPAQRQTVHPPHRFQERSA